MAIERAILTGGADASSTAEGRWISSIESLLDGGITRSSHTNKRRADLRHIVLRGRIEGN